MSSRSKVIAIGEVPVHLWEREFEITSLKFHVIAAWVAIIFDPVFAITDYFNIGEAWLSIFYLRLGVAALTMATLYLHRIYYVPSAIVVAVPFTLISLQNAYTYSFLNNEHLLGHNLNYVALLIGAGMFVVWSWQYSFAAIILSALATTYFVMSNSLLTIDQFFLQGGLILIASAFFMTMLIRTRYNLTVREIKARIALQMSNDSINSQNEEIKEQAGVIRQINENLENLVRQRTDELERKNKALEDYAFINAHKLRRPLASILGLVNLMNKTTAVDDQIVVREHLNKAALELEAVINSIKLAIEEGQKK
jgi:signal transduction histidine kinase